MTIRSTLSITLASIPLLAAAGAAQASSDDAWGQFQKDVGKACVTAAKGLIENGRTVVDPFGSEHYGMAVVSGKAVGAKVTISTICVYDKKTRKAEIGGEISADTLMVKTGK